MSRKYEHMTREKFSCIFRELIESQQTVDAFCVNYGISDSDFYYWKKKFGLSREDFAKDEESTSSQISQIRIMDESPSRLVRQEVVPNKTRVQRSKPDISIELPNGIRMSFNGENGCDAAVSILSKLQMSNVLP